MSGFILAGLQEMEWETFVLEVHYYVLNRCIWICSGFHNKMLNSEINKINFICHIHNYIESI